MTCAPASDAATSLITPRIQRVIRIPRRRRPIHRDFRPGYDVKLHPRASCASHLVGKPAQALSGPPQTEGLSTQKGGANHGMISGVSFSWHATMGEAGALLPSSLRVSVRFRAREMMTRQTYSVDFLALMRN